MNLFLLTVMCVLLHLTYGQNCGKCLPNGVSCVNQNSCRFCTGVNPSTSVQTCENDYICTDSDNICEPKVQTNGIATVAACSTSCNICPNSTSIYTYYTCASKNHFARCDKGTATTTGACEGNTMCNSNIYALTGKICAPSCVIDFFGYSNTCSNDDITTSTTIAPSTTPNIQNLKVQCNEAQNTNQKFFYINNKDDLSCRTYIYCEKFDGEMEALFIRCRSGYYFDSTTSRCVDSMPADCGITTTTTSTSNPADTTTPTASTSNPADTTTTTSPSNPTDTTTTTITSNPTATTTTTTTSPSNPTDTTTTTTSTSNPVDTTTTTTASTSNPADTTTASN